MSGSLTFYRAKQRSKPIQNVPSDFDSTWSDKVALVPKYTI